MGILVTAFEDSATKPQYLLTGPDAANVAIGDGQLAVFSGSTQAPQMVKTNGVVKCLQALRERDWPNPATSAVNAAVYDFTTQTLAPVVLSGAQPTLTEDQVAVIQGADFTKSADSNTGHVRRMNQAWREVNGGSVIRGELQLEAFATDPAGQNIDLTVSVGTGPVAEGRTGALLTPDVATGYMVSRADTAPPQYDIQSGGEEYVFVGEGNQNEVLHSADLTQTGWSGNTRTFDQVGLEGLPNTATLVTDNSGGSLTDRNAEVNPAPGTNMVLRLFYAMPDGYDESYFPSIESNANGQIQECAVQWNPNTLEWAQASLTGGDPATFEVGFLDHGNVQEICVGYPRINTNQLQLTFLPARSGTLGGLTPLVGGSVIVMSAEIHADKRMEQVLGTPPCVNGAAVTPTPSTAVTLPIANHDNTEGIYTADIRVLGDTNDLNQTNLETVVLNVGAGNTGEILGLRELALLSGAQLFSHDQDSEVTSGNVTALASSVAVAYSATLNTHLVSTGQEFGVGGGYTGFLVDTDIRVGPLSFRGNHRPLLVRNIRRWTITEVTT